MSVKHLLNITVCSAYVRHYKGDHKKSENHIFNHGGVYIIAREMTNTCEKLVRIMVENILV